MIRATATIVELDMSELDEILGRVDAQQLRADDFQTIRTLIESYVCLTQAVGDKNTTIRRLRQMLFGVKTEKTAAVIDSPLAADETTPGPEGEATLLTTSSAGEAEGDSQTPVRGHGRNGAEDYVGAEKIEIPHPSLSPGDPCPQCKTGTVYDTGRPGVVVRLVGQAPVGAKVYYLQKLRCHLCGVVFTAELPQAAGEEKYDATVGSMIALLKYGTGVPFNRAETLEGSLGIPLPASTQWDLVAAQAERAEPVFGELVRQAAQGDVLHNDDTTVKILELMDKRARQAALAEASGGAAEEESAETNAIRAAPHPATVRTGMFTSGIVATREGRRVALFFSGHQHAGENLKDVLARRAVDRPAPIQMCDALSRNRAPSGSGKLTTLLANCLAHGRRQFVEVAELFPEPCRHVLESLRAVYHNDALAREQQLACDDRLVFHQLHSGPIMTELRAWLVGQLDERRVEPNSGLGKAMAYLLRHWEKLTLFLRVPGAPLDNNICERALKKAIRHRRNSLFYKTRNGAHVGDVFMSLIHTCELAQANPFDYLTQLERHAAETQANPQRWMPWNYRKALKDSGEENGKTPREQNGQLDRFRTAAAPQDAGEMRES